MTKNEICDNGGWVVSAVSSGGPLEVAKQTEAVLAMMDTMPEKFGCAGFNREECRAFIHKAEEEIMKLPQAPLKNRHFFSHGVYARELVIPAGTVLTGEIHKDDCFNFVLSGKIMILTEETPLCTLTAPMVVKSGSNIKKLGYALEDTVFVTTHPCNTDNLALIEKEIFTKTYTDEDTHILPTMDFIF